MGLLETSKNRFRGHFAASFAAAAAAAAAALLSAWCHIPLWLQCYAFYWLGLWLAAATTNGD